MRTFLIQGGRPSNLHFKIEETTIPTIYNEDQRFLGKLPFFKEKSGESYEHIEMTIVTKTKNVEQRKFRNEYQLWIYKHYIISTVIFLLTIHKVT